MAPRVGSRPTRIRLQGPRNLLPDDPQEGYGPSGRGLRPVHLGNVGLNEHCPPAVPRKNLDGPRCEAVLIVRMSPGRVRTLICLGFLYCIAPRHSLWADTETVLPVRAFSGLAVDHRHRHVFISQGDSITVVDFDGHIVTSIENQPGAAGMLVDSAHGVLYVALSGADAVSEINTKTLVETQRRSLGLGVCPRTLAVAHRLLWFGFTCSNNACPSCTRQPQVGGIGSLDPRRGDIVAYDAFIQPPAGRTSPP